MASEMVERASGENLQEIEELERLLPDELETFIADGTLDEQCDPDWADRLRLKILKYFPSGPPPVEANDACPDCNGFGLVRSEENGTIYEDGCDTCGGSGHALQESETEQ